MRSLAPSVRVLAASALMMFLCTPAHAGGGAAEAVSYTWTGLYGGINAAWDRQKSDWDATSQNGDDGAVGLQVGYGAQLGDNYYIGIEGSVETGGTDGKSTCFGGQTCESEINSISDISLRLGVTSAQTLLYLKGGIAYEDTTYHVGGTHDGGDGVGPLLGGGIEYGLMYNLTTKLEYNFMRFGSDDHTIAGNSFSSQNTVNLVKLGFNFKFD